MVINIGDEVTEFCLFHNGTCNYAQTVVVGIKHLVNDLSVGLGVNYETAKDILIKHGNALQKSDNSDQQVESAGNFFKKNKIELIINLRLKELFTLVKSELEKLNVVQKVKHGVYLTGGGAQIKEIDLLIKEIFNNIPVYSASIEFDFNQIEKAEEKYDSNTFSTVAGLAIMGHNGGDQDEDSLLETVTLFLKNSFDRIKYLFQGDK